jgi:glucokinase
MLGAIDIGGTKTGIGIVDAEGKILSYHQRTTDTSELSTWLRICTEQLEDCAREINCRMEDLEGVGINLPGMVDTNRGLLLACSYPGWTQKPVVRIMKELTGIEKIYVENDVNSCAIGEMYFGLQEKYKDFLWMTVSTGIGGAMVSNRQLIRGAWGCAGEIGHVKVEYNDPKLCACGGKGCLEAHASGTAITNEVLLRAKLDSEFNALFEGIHEPINAKSCAMLAREGNQTANEIYQRAAVYLGRGIGYGISLFNPQAVIIGGGVGMSLDLMTEEIEAVLANTVNKSLLPVDIVPTKMGYMGALLGAAALVLYNQK